MLGGVLGLGHLRSAGALSFRSLGSLLTSSLLSRRDNSHRLGLRKLVELAAEVDGDSLDRHAEQVVDFVLEHEGCKKVAGDGRHHVSLLNALDLVVAERAIVFHERVDQIGTRIGVHREDLHEARVLAFHAVGKRRHVGQLERNELRGEFHRSYAPFFCCAIAFAFSSRMPIACTTPSIIASGRTAQPGTYTSTGIALSTPPSTL